MIDLERLFKGLADKSRLRIINLLMHGELCGCDIQYVLRASQPNVSRHLTYLKHAGLVLDRRDGYRIFYRLADHKQGTKKLLFEFLEPLKLRLQTRKRAGHRKVIRRKRETERSDK